MKKLFIQSVLSLVVLGSATTAFAQTSVNDGHDSIDSPEKMEIKTPEQKVGFLLLAIHGIPPKEAFDAIPGARDILERIALNFNALQQRAAISALAYYPSDATFQTLAYLLKSDKSSRGLKMNVLQQIGRVYKSDKALKLLGKYLNDKDMYVRMGAVYGLSQFNTDESFALMKARYAVEKEELVRKKLERYGIRIN